MRSSKAPGPLQGAEFSETTCNKLSTINNLYIRNRKKPLQNTTEYISQYSYRAYPPAKRIDNKLRRMKRENTAPPPPFQSYRTRQNGAKENRKSILSRHPHQQSAQIYSYRPGTPHSGDSHTRICTSPGSPEKFPRAQHTQLRKTEHETISIHTQITEITVNKRKTEIFTT
jgi:hypothetical protein